MNPNSSLIKIFNFINNQFIGCNSYFDSYNPATGNVNSLIPDSGSDEVNKAVEAAKNAFKT